MVFAGFFPMYSSLPTLPVCSMFQDPQGAPKTTEGTKPYIHYAFSYTYLTMIKFNL